MASYGEFPVCVPVETQVPVSDTVPVSQIIQGGAMEGGEGSDAWMVTDDSISTSLSINEVWNGTFSRQVRESRIAGAVAWVGNVAKQRLNDLSLEIAGLIATTTTTTKL